MQPPSFGSPSGEMSQEQYSPLSGSGYPSPYDPALPVLPPFDSGPFQDSLSATKTDEFDTMARRSVVVALVVMIAILGLAVYIYMETSRAGESSVEVVDVRTVGTKGSGDRTSMSTTQVYTPRPGTSVVFKTTRTSTSESSTTVLPSGAQFASDFINGELNRSFAPCDDFYNFVCSNPKLLLPTVSYEVVYRAQIGIWDTLNDMHIPPSFQRASEKAAGLYRACISLASNASRTELQPVKAFLSKLRLDISNIDHDPYYDIPVRLVHLSCVYGFPTFVKFGLYWTLSEGKRFDVGIHKEDQNWMNTQHEKARPQMLEFYRSFLEAYDPNINSTELSERIAEVEVIAKDAIAEAQKTGRTRVMTIGELGSYTKGYYEENGWSRLVSQATSGKYNAKSTMTVWDNATAVLVLLLDKGRMPRDDARLLMSWSLVRRLLALANGRMLAAEAMSNYGDHEDPIVRMCFNKITGEMPLAAAHRLFSTMVPPSALGEARRVGRNLKRTLMKILKRARWIRGPLWCMMNAKAKALYVEVGYPDALSTESMLEDFFHVHKGFTAPLLEVRRVMTLRHFRKNFNVYWDTTTGNAVYFASRLFVSIYGSVLQPPIFFKGAPAAVNYGGVGQIIGHELMHAFDPHHIKKVRDVAAFEKTPEKKLYTGKVLCLRNSYYQAESESRERTLSRVIDSEGFVDYAGIVLAYAAFKSLPEHERTETLPETGLTADQIFFVSHCLKYCSLVNGTKREEGSRYWHGRSRCIVLLRNMPEFAAAFNCKRGDRMNPEAKCSFW